MNASSARVTCPLCGHRFETSGLQACQGCPLQSNCSMICCPQCGHTSVDPEASRLVQGVRRLARMIGMGGDEQYPPHQRDPRAAGEAGHPDSSRSYTKSGSNLAGISAGRTVVVTELAPELPSNRHQALLAFGVEPGRRLRVLQQSPLTVIRVNHLELALEHELAGLILVEVTEKWGPDH